MTNYPQNDYERDVEILANAPHGGDHSMIDDVEVVGNIYANPELLEGKQ